MRKRQLETNGETLEVVDGILQNLDESSQATKQPTKRTRRIHRVNPDFLGKDSLRAGTRGQTTQQTEQSNPKSTINQK